MTIKELFENYSYKNHRVRIFFKDADKPSYSDRIDKIPMEFEYEEVNTFFINYGPDTHMVVELKKTAVQWFTEQGSTQQAILINKALSK